MTWQDEIKRQCLAVRNIVPKEYQRLSFNDVPTTRKTCDKIITALQEIDSDILLMGTKEINWRDQEKIVIDFDTEIEAAWVRYFVWQYGDEEPGVCIEFHLQKVGDTHTEQYVIDCFPSTKTPRLSSGYFVFEIFETGYEGSHGKTIELTDEQAEQYLKVIDEVATSKVLDYFERNPWTPPTED